MDKILLHLTNSTSKQDLHRKQMELVARSVPATLVGMQLMTYYFFFYCEARTFTLECLTNFLICIFFDIMILWSHSEARKDPGFTENLSDLLTEKCKKCNAPKTPQVHHCKSCDKCVFLMDHHCIWTNNCVAYHTFKPFVLFNLYVALLSAFGVFTIFRNVIKRYPGNSVLEKLT